MSNTYYIRGMKVRCLFIIAVFFFGCFSIKAQPGNKKVLVLHQIYDLGKLNYRIDRIKFKKFVGGLLTLKRAHGEFLIVSVTVINKSKKQLIMDDSFFKLEDNSGAVYDYSPDAAAALELSDFPGVPFFGMTINPNIAKTGKAIFEVPSKNKSYHLVLFDENIEHQMSILLN
jgi:hypothetical protein